MRVGAGRYEQEKRIEPEGSGALLLNSPWAERLQLQASPHHRTGRRGSGPKKIHGDLQVFQDRRVGFRFLSRTPQKGGNK
jgi:hypothetical protein